MVGDAWLGHAGVGECDRSGPAAVRPACAAGAGRDHSAQFVFDCPRIGFKGVRLTALTRGVPASPRAWTRAAFIRCRYEPFVALAGPLDLLVRRAKAADRSSPTTRD